MKLRLKYILICAITLVSMSAVALVSHDTSDYSLTAPSAEKSGDYIYTLGQYSGKVAVFEYGNAQPIEVLECPIDSLPDEDAKQLLVGISVKSDEELQHLIEAYD